MMRNDPSVPGDAGPPAAPDTWADRRHCGDTAMRIDADGVWHHAGRPIMRPALVKLFASVLERGEDGSHWLITPAETVRIEVEDAPFVAVELLCDGSGLMRLLSLRTNIDEIVPIDDDHPLRLHHDRESGEPRPYIRVRGGLEARLLRPVFLDLAALAEETADGAIGIRFGGRFRILEPGK